MYITLFKGERPIMKMKKFGKVMLVATIALGGVGTTTLATPVDKVEAASYSGVSVNTTKANYYKPEDVIVKLKNDNNVPMTVILQLEKKDSKGVYNFVEYAEVVKLQPRQAASRSYQTRYPDYWEMWKKGATDQFRYRIITYKGTQSDWHTDKIQYVGDFFTSSFYVHM